MWRALQPDLARRVAIKALTPAMSADASAVTLRLEARRLSELDCPHIVAIYDFVDDAANPYLVTEWVDGETLRDMLEREDADAAAIALCTAGGPDGPGLCPSTPDRPR